MRESTVIAGWQAEGRLEERLETLRAALLRVLQARFKVAIPADLASAVHEVADPNELSRWLDIAATADSFDAFRAALSP